MPTRRPYSPPAKLPERWKRLWRQVHRQLADEDRWDDGLVPLLADYVTAKRLAAEHQEAADTEPYTHNSEGRAFAHPAFRLATEARKEARELADQLGLIPEIDPFDEHDDDEPPDAPEGDQAGL
jgi:P27 family predicted phage terminase small subunit